MYTSGIFIARYITHPLVMSIDRDYFNWNITYPSLTICSKARMNETALKNTLE